MDLSVRWASTSASDDELCEAKRETTLRSVPVDDLPWYRVSRTHRVSALRCHG